MRGMPGYFTSAALACLLLTACSRHGTSGNITVKAGEVGSALSGRGEITDESLDYVFKPRHVRTVRDLFNNLYFQGDTLCFSFTFSGDVSGEDFRVSFVNPATGEAFPAERLEKYGDRVFGFSLVGTVMEQFFRERLNDTAPPDGFCCRDIPFEVALAERGTKGSTATRIKGAFQIRYGD
jgi:hypothetical protein